MPTPHEMLLMGAQWFPIYYSMGPTSFKDSTGTASGAAGATVRLSKAIPNWPIMFLGLRITNVYGFPNDEPTTADLARFDTSRRYLDDLQTIRITLSQQSIASEETLQVQVTGKSGVYWAPFPVPFPMAGGNSVNVDIRRSVGYPTIGDEAVLPQAQGTMICAVARNNEQTMQVLRLFQETLQPGAMPAGFRATG